MEDARRAALDTFRLLCCTLVEDLEQGNTCTFGDGNRCRPDQGAFDCSSMILGNALLALRANCGKEWKSAETWSGSVWQHYKQLQEVAVKLDGPSQIRYGQHKDHWECGLSYKFLGQIKQVYATTGLKLQELGNHVYRVVSVSPPEI